MKYTEFVKRQKALESEVRKSWTKETLNEIREDFLAGATEGLAKNPAQEAVGMALAGAVVDKRDAQKAWNEAFSAADRGYMADQLVTMAPIALVRHVQPDTVSEAIQTRLDALDCILLGYKHGLLRVSFYDYDQEKERILTGNIDQIENMVNGIEVEIPGVVKAKPIDVEVEQEKFYALTQS